MNKLLSLTLLATSAIAYAAEPELVSLKDACPTIRTPKMRKNNAACCVRPEVAEHLNAVQEELAALGLGLKVYEGYCEMCDDECLLNSEGCTIALPEECNRHCLGTSVDVTLVTKKGKELEMPCAYDDFCTKANRNCMDLPDHVLANRELLEQVMVKHGFVATENSWWHFDIASWQDCSMIMRSCSDCNQSCEMNDCSMNCDATRCGCSKPKRSDSACCDEQDQTRCGCSKPKRSDSACCDEQDQTRCGCSKPKKSAADEQDQTRCGCSKPKKPKKTNK